MRRLLLVTTVAALIAGCDEKPNGATPKGPVATVVASAETVVMPDADDAADDPAIWVHPTAPESSLIIGTNKQRGLFVYRLDGTELAKREDGRMNNVDLRQNVTLGEFQGDLVAATNRTNKSISLYTFDGATGALTPVLSIPTGFNDPYGLCMYRSAKTGDLYVFANNADDGMFAQWQITATGAASFEAEQIRSFGVGSQAEGCAADDEHGVLFVAEEDVGLYAYFAEAEEAAANKNGRLIIDTVTKGNLTADAEGVAILTEPGGGGYVIVSSQGSYSYNVYDRTSPYAFRGAFKIGPTGDDVGIDGVEETDGLEVTSASLGGIYAEGMFVAQDGFNYDGAQTSKRANQNFKMVPWSTIREALKLPAPAPVEAVPAPEAAPTAPN